MHGGTDSAFNAKSVPRYVLFQVTGSGSLTCPASSGVWLVPTERCVHAATKHCVYVDPLWIAGSLTCPASSGVIHRTLCSGCHQTLCICTPLWIDQPCNSHGLVPRHRFCIQCKIGAQVCSVPGDRFWVIDLSSQFWRMVSPHRTLCSCSHQTLCICRPFVDSWVIDLSSEFWRYPQNAVFRLPPNSVYMYPFVDRSTMQLTWSGPTKHCVYVATELCG